MTITSKDVVVAHRRDVKKVVDKMSENEITQVLDVDQVFETLYPFSQVSGEVKKAHVDDINSFK